jgi:diaminopimelate epimerase
LNDFVKVEAGGNDFILFHGKPPRQNVARQALQACDRHFGIGADGIVWYSIDRKAPTALVTMKCYNPDGTRMGSCINASRSVALHAHSAGLVDSSSVVVATEKRLVYLSVAGSWVEAGLLKLNARYVSLPDWAPTARAALVYLGDPHLVLAVSAEVLASDHFGKVAKKLREWRDLVPSGANVHFISKSGEQWRIRTFERGVEAETLCCGSGSISALWAIRALGIPLDNTVLQTRSGAHLVGNYVDRTWKIAGKVQLVFAGRLNASAGTMRNGT